MTTFLNVMLSFLFLITTANGNFQEDQLQIRMRRNWGYSSGTGKIQGTFTIKASGPEDISQVIFFLDDQVLGAVNEPPFDFRFVTDDYSLGPHQIHAEGKTVSDDELGSNTIQVEFVTAGQGWQAAGNIIVPLVVIIMGAVGLAIVVPFVFTRGKKEQLPPGAPRSYGYSGGAICPKCSRPFSRHIYGLNLGTHNPEH